MADLLRLLSRMYVALATLVAISLGGWAGVHERYAEGAFYLTLAIATMVAATKVK